MIQCSFREIRNCKRKLKKSAHSLSWVAVLVGASSHTPKGHRFGSQSGCILGCRFNPW